MLWSTTNGMFMKSYLCGATGQCGPGSPVSCFFNRLYRPLVDCVMKCVGTSAENRFRLSTKRTSLFKSAVRQSSRLLAAEVCGSVAIMLDTQCSEVVWRVLPTTPFASFPFTSPLVRHRVPSHCNWTLRLLGRGSGHLQDLFLPGSTQT